MYYYPLLLLIWVLIMNDRHLKRWWLAAGFLFTAFPASAETWRMPSETGSSVQASLTRFANGEQAFAVMYFDMKCKGFEDEVNPHDSIIVNGVKVKAQTQCLAEEFVALSAKTNAGDEHIMQEFIRSEKVTIDKVLIDEESFSFTFSAKGFAAAFERNKNAREGL